MRNLYDVGRWFSGLGLDRPGLDGRRNLRGGRALAAVCLAAWAASSVGCVHRRVTIRSNPPGALVYVDNIHEIGPTPVSFDFVYYGTRKIRLVKSGYETIEDEITIRPPAYQFFPIDFVVENLWPAEIKDHRHMTYNMESQLLTPNDELLGRANELRTAPASFTSEAPLSPTPAAPPAESPYQLPGTFTPPESAAPLLMPPR